MLVLVRHAGVRMKMEKQSQNDTTGSTTWTHGKTDPASFIAP